MAEATVSLNCRVSTKIHAAIMKICESDRRTIRATVEMLLEESLAARSKAKGK
jgi:hypothetical protein